MLMTYLFVALVLAGSTVLATWAYKQAAHRRPTGLRAAVAHVGLAYILVRLVPPAVRLSTATFPHALAVIFGLAVITIPAVTYLLLSWIWLIVCLRDHLPSKPQSGHPALTDTR